MRRRRLLRLGPMGLALLRPPHPTRGESLTGATGVKAPPTLTGNSPGNKCCVRCVHLFRGPARNTCKWRMRDAWARGWPRLRALSRISWVGIRVSLGALIGSPGSSGLPGDVRAASPTRI
jgi:hypothetical protein